jgi:endonuclease/exonuclease/phosphatase (EEP) superfamily protein YafD
VAFHDGVWPLLLANMFSLYVFALAYPLLLSALVRRRWFLAAASGVSVVFHLALAVPPHLPRVPPPSVGPSIRVVTANLLMVHPNPSSLVAELATLDADVLMLQEVSPPFEAALRAGGLLERYPHHRIIAREDSFGISLLSRLPLDGVEIVPMAGLPQIQATVWLGDRAIDLLNVHTLPPRVADYVERHHRGLEAILTWTRARSGPFIVAGDFNSTPYSRFSSEMSAFAEDAWHLAGRGYGHTAPNGLMPIPPIALDHIYLSADLTVRAVELGVGAGSDHRPVVANDVALRAARAASPLHGT